jgi:hypothetical protein
VDHLNGCGQKMKRRSGKMKRISILLVATFCMGFSNPAKAQMGANWFSKPAIAEVVNPVVGKGAQYQTTSRDQDNAKPEVQEMTVVGKESVEGKEGFWLEMAHQDRNQSGMGYAKILFTKDDFQFHRMIVQQPGQQAIEMPFHPSDKTKSQMQGEVEKWHAVGTETITVPAGTFSCKHWQKDKSAGDSGDSDIWTSDKVSPFGVVKEVSPGQTMVLVKVITDAQDHITGPVQKFDPEEMKRRMMEKMQQQKPPKS